MNTNEAGVPQMRDTWLEVPTAAVTTSSSFASHIVCRNATRVSRRPVWGSTRAVSWYSQPGWCSSEPRWWSTVTMLPPVTRAAAPRNTVDRPQ